MKARVCSCYEVRAEPVAPKAVTGPGLIIIHPGLRASSVLWENALFLKKRGDIRFKA